MLALFLPSVVACGTRPNEGPKRDECGKWWRRRRISSSLFSQMTEGTNKKNEFYSVDEHYYLPSQARSPWSERGRISVSFLSAQRHVLGKKGRLSRECPFSLHCLLMPAVAPDARFFIRRALHCCVRTCTNEGSRQGAKTAYANLFLYKK